MSTLGSFEFSPFMVEVYNCELFIYDNKNLVLYSMTPLKLFFIEDYKSFCLLESMEVGLVSNLRVITSHELKSFSDVCLLEKTKKKTKAEFALWQVF